MRGILPDWAALRIVRVVRELTVIGAPTSAGAYAPGQEDGPRALRERGLIDRLGAGGVPVRDAGDVEGFRWRPDPERPRAANAAAVADRARQVAERVAAAAAGDRVLVLGGDCTVGVGTVAGLVARGGSPGLVYFDRHADLNVPDSTVDGALDWMGVAHMLDADGTVSELVGVVGRRPLLEANRLCYLGLGSATAFEREQIARRGIAVIDLPATIDDPAAAARAALTALDGRDEIAVHFDVDVLDFLDAPLAENTDRGRGLPLAGAGRALAALWADERVSALTVTEFNPHHGAPDGATTRRLIDVLAGALA
jgi:arginase